MASQARYGAAASCGQEPAGRGHARPATPPASAGSTAPPGTAGAAASPGTRPGSPHSAATSVTGRRDQQRNAAATPITRASARSAARSARKPRYRRIMREPQVAPGRAARAGGEERGERSARPAGGAGQSRRPAGRPRISIRAARRRAERVPGPEHRRPGRGGAQVQHPGVPRRRPGDPDLGRRAAVVAGPGQDLGHDRRGAATRSCGSVRPRSPSTHRPSPARRRAVRPVHLPVRQVLAERRPGCPSGPAAAARCASTPPRRGVPGRRLQGQPDRGHRAQVRQPGQRGRRPRGRAARRRPGPARVSQTQGRPGPSRAESA